MLPVRHIIPLQAMLHGAPTSRDALDGLRNRALQQLIRHAYARVPYYRSLFDRHNIDPDLIRCPEDLSAIPITTKEDLRRAGPKATVDSALDPDELHLVRTSGSTAKPFTVRRTYWEQITRFCYWLRAFRERGMRLTDRRTSVRFLGHAYRKKRSAWLRIFNLFGLLRHQLVECSLPAQEILKELRRDRPDVLGGSPSDLYEMARKVTQRDRELINPRYVGAGGETVTPGMRRCIEEAFGAPVYEGYGCNELNLIAWECVETGEFHTNDDALIVEIMTDGRPARPGEQGELVGTSLISYAMPFIRYRMEDIVTQGSYRCRCGSPFGTIRSIKGRFLNFIHLADGTTFHPYTLLGNLIYGSDWIGRYQVVQRHVHAIEIQIEPLEQPDNGEIRRLENELRELVPDQLDLSLNLVSRIEKPPGEKFCVVQSEIEDLPR